MALSLSFLQWWSTTGSICTNCDHFIMTIRRISLFAFCHFNSLAVSACAPNQQIQQHKCPWTKKLYSSNIITNIIGKFKFLSDFQFQSGFNWLCLPSSCFQPPSTFIYLQLTSPLSPALIPQCMMFAHRSLPIHNSSRNLALSDGISSLLFPSDDENRSTSTLECLTGSPWNKQIVIK